jgi:NADH:ubiquinone oxidoreductase subunit 6 (subunit J)
MSDFLINAGLWLTYLMIAGAAITAVAYPIMYLAKHPEQAKGALKGIGALVAVVILSYVLASGDIMEFPGFEKFNMTEASTKRVGMGLITFYFLAFGAVAAVLYAELGKLFKK